jgi:glycine/D-amino acid oxidase-like deaminating enzyme
MSLSLIGKENAFVHSASGQLSRRRSSHAVVIGGSLAGMLAARVLSDHFERVTVIERDALPDEPTPRKGVPYFTEPAETWRSTDGRNAPRGAGGRIPRRRRMGVRS